MVREQVGRDEDHPVGDAVADRVLARELEGIGGHVDRDHQHLVGHLLAPQRRQHRDGDRARPGAHVDDAQRRRALAPAAWR